MEETIIIHFVELLITMFTAVAASSGFWLYIDKTRSKKDAMNRLMIGLAHNEIITMSKRYIKRKFITVDEHENLCEFLYKPYKDLGGNGSADRLIQEVNSLPIFDQDYHIHEKMKGEKDDTLGQSL